MLVLLVTAYGVGAAVAGLLQARQLLERRRSCEVSALFFAVYAGGYALWLAYGVSIDSLPLVVVDATGVLCATLTLDRAVPTRLTAQPRHLEELPNIDDCPEAPSRPPQAGPIRNQRRAACRAPRGEADARLGVGGRPAEELERLGDRLGGVRDLDVLSAHLERELALLRSR
jgi:uncharacterized protein with PQ loop repeat